MHNRFEALDIWQLDHLGGALANPSIALEKTPFGTRVAMLNLTQDSLVWSEASPRRRMSQAASDVSENG